MAELKLSQHAEGVIAATAAPAPAGVARALLGGLDLGFDPVDGSLVHLRADLPLQPTDAALLDALIGPEARAGIEARQTSVYTAPGDAAVARCVQRLALIWRLRMEGYPLAAIDLTAEIWPSDHEVGVEARSLLAVEAAGLLLELGELADRNDVVDELEAAIPALLVVVRTSLWYSLDGPLRPVARACLQHFGKDGLEPLASALEAEDTLSVSEAAEAVVNAPVVRVRGVGSSVGELQEHLSLDPGETPTDILLPGERTVEVTWSDTLEGPEVEISVPLRSRPEMAPACGSAKWIERAKTLGLVGLVVRITDGMPVASTPLVMTEDSRRLVGRVTLDPRVDVHDLTVEVRRTERGRTSLARVIDTAEATGIDVDEPSNARELLKAHQFACTGEWRAWRACTVARLANHPLLADTPAGTSISTAASKDWVVASYSWADATEAYARIGYESEAERAKAKAASCRANADVSDAASAVTPLLAEQVFRPDASWTLR